MDSPYHIVCYSDGACRGNPGICSVGIVGYLQLSGQATDNNGKIISVGRPGRVGKTKLTKSTKSSNSNKKDNNRIELYKISQLVGDGYNSSNFAEYQAVLVNIVKIKEVLDKGDLPGIRKSFNNGFNKGMRIVNYMDSELVCRQLNGIYKVKDPGLRKIFNQIRRIQKQIMSKHNCTMEYIHVNRERNQIADNLANYALDRYKSFKEGKDL